MEKNKPKNSSVGRNKTEDNKAKIWFKEKFLPTMGKVGNQRYLASIRDAFGTMIPIIIAGSIGVLINAIIFGGAGSGYVSLMGLLAKMAHPELDMQNQIHGMILGSEGNIYAALYPGWHQANSIGGLAFGHINTVTVGMMSIWFSFLFGYYIAVSRNFKSPIIAGLISTTSFLLASLGEVAFFMDAKGLIAAIIFGIGATEMFIWLSGVRGLNIKLPDGVPPAVGKSFQVFLPAFFTLATVGALNIVFLAPAIVTGDLAVTSSQSFIFQAGAGKGKEWSWFFANPDITKAIMGSLNDEGKMVDGLLQMPQFAGHEQLLQDLSARFSTNTQEDWLAWYNTLSSTDKSVVTTSVMVLQGVPVTSIWSVTDNALLNLISDNKGSYIVTARWMGITLGATQFGVSAAIYQFITSWFISFATGSGGLGIAILYVFLVSFFWFFGIHGSNIVGGIFEPIFVMILGINTALVTSLGYDAAVATGQMGVFARSFFDAYMYVGGSGGTLGLIAAILFFSKRRELKAIAKFSAPAGIFQINEPVIFGIPIILNPMFAAPFILTPILSLLVGWIFSPAVLGFVKYSYIAVPWTAPWFLGAMLTSLDVNALLPAAIVGALTVVTYSPFVLLDNYMHFRKLKKNDYSLYMETMRYFNDPKYKFITDTQTKYEAILDRANIVESNTSESIDWWTKKMTKKNTEKVTLKIDKLQQQMQTKIDKLTQKAELYKANREAKIPENEARWEATHLKRMEKFNARNEKEKSNEKALK